MGTSSNPRSPNTPSWRIVRAVVGSAGSPIDQQSREIWRAAAADLNANLINYLSSPRVFQIAQIAQEASSPSDAVDRFAAVVRKSGNAPFLDAAAQRALLRAVAQKGGVGRFAGELLSETAAYYASRELPSVVGRAGRIGTAADAISLKGQLRSIARSEGEGTIGSPSSSDSWATRVRTAIDKLARRKG